MHFIAADAALQLSHAHLDDLRREAEGHRIARRLRRRPVRPPVSPRPGGGLAA